MYPSRTSAVRRVGKLKNLTGLGSLHWLRLSKTRVGDAGMVHVGAMRSLQVLYLDETDVTDIGLNSLTGMNQILEVHLDVTRVTQTGVQQLQKALPNVKIVR